MDPTQTIAMLLDAAWYAQRYPDVAPADALQHFIAHGLAEGRDPNPFFDGAWYLRRYPDAAGALALLHYMQIGAGELRDPHPRFNAAWYAGQHPDAGGNPLVHHLRFGVATGWASEPARDPNGLHDLRRAGRIAVVVVPERFANGVATPCGYIRLLQPLDHLASSGKIDLIVADPVEALGYRADVIATQRYALPDAAAADALAAHCRAQGIRLLYDLDDDLLHIPPDHPEAAVLRPRARLVARMLRHADTIWVSTDQLRHSLGAAGRTAVVVPNGLDERLWTAPPARISRGKVRILYMGTATHEADFALVAPALARLAAAFAGRVRIDLIGVTAQDDLPGWINRVVPPAAASPSYPRFVAWMIGQSWDIGIAPLADSGFNRCKSAIKTLDYAAIGMAVLASDVPAYRGSLAQLVEDTGWFDALAGLIAGKQSRLERARAAREYFLKTGTLEAQTAMRMTALRALIRKKISPSRRGQGRA